MLGQPTENTYGLPIKLNTNVFQSSVYKVNEQIQGMQEVPLFEKKFAST